MEMIGGSIVEGIMFYWLFWIFWVLSTFFMRRDDKRWKISLWLLLAIIFSLQSIMIFGFEISLTALFMLLSTYMIFSNQNKRTGTYLFITSFIVMLAYVAFHLFELIDPVWLVIDRKWLLSMLLFYLIVSLHKSIMFRFLSLFIGSIHGDILLSIILKQFSIGYSVGTLSFMDVLALSFAFLIVLEGMNRLSLHFEQYFQQIEKERGKLS